MTNARPSLQLSETPAARRFRAWYWRRRAREICVKCRRPTRFWRCLRCRLAVKARVG